MSAARRVLLVDDEPRIVSGLQRVLRPHRSEWNTSIATSGAEALTMMTAQPFDVVVSDMRMPHMDGAKLFEIVRERFPSTMRIVLSGQTDAEAAIRVIPFAHQFLHKPTPPEVLVDVLRRVVGLQQEIIDPDVRAAIGGLESLPAVPAVIHQLGELLAQENVALESVTVLVEKEPAIVVKLLQIVNSAFFGAGKRITSIGEAIAYLGTVQLRHMVTVIAVAAALPVRAASFDADAFHEHAHAVARAGAALADGPEMRQSAFAAGLLHDVGKLVIASRMPALYDATNRSAHESGRTFEDCEGEHGSPGHTRIGGCLLDLWGIPFEIVDAVVRHPKAPQLSEGPVTPRDLVYLAHRSIDSAGARLDGADAALASRLNLLDRVAALSRDRSLDRAREQPSKAARP